MTLIRITHPDVIHDVGDEIDVPQAKAERLVNIGYADYVNAQDAEQADEPQAPAKSATKAEWVDYAVSQGTDRTEAEASTKAALIERHG